MKKWVKFLISIVFIYVIYFGFLFVVDRRQSTGNAPAFQVPTSVLTVSVHDDESALLENVKAVDDEDGDISSKVFVESISGFDENNYRTITFGVFDSDDNLTRATRTVQYTDYQKPEITLTRAICYTYVRTLDDFRQFVKAESVVDGDLTSSINVDKEYYEGNNQYIVFSVTDSCGTTSVLTLKGDLLKEEMNINIELSQYLIRVSPGTKINPLNYVEDISGTGISSATLKEKLEITNNYNPYETGMYEYYYRISLANGDYGITKLVVIVE